MSTATAAPENAIESPLSRLSAEQIEQLGTSSTRSATTSAPTSANATAATSRA